MDKKELNEWYELRQQIVNGYHMSKSDYQELLRLNHLVMEASHKIHNDNMLSSGDMPQIIHESEIERDEDGNEIEMHGSHSTFKCTLACV